MTNGGPPKAVATIPRLRRADRVAASKRCLVCNAVPLIGEYIEAQDDENAGNHSREKDIGQAIDGHSRSLAAIRSNMAKRMRIMATWVIQ